MEADLFSPGDAAALLAIHRAAEKRPMSPQEYLEAMRAAGLMTEPRVAMPSLDGWHRRAA